MAKLVDSQSSKLRMNEPAASIPNVKCLTSNANLEDRGKDIKYLIYHCTHPTGGEVLVYVDHEIDLEWEYDDKAGEVLDQLPLRTSVRKVINTVAALEPIAHSWPHDLKLTSKRLLGEAVASVLRDDLEGAKQALGNAKSFVHAKSTQVSRYWTLQGCMIVGGVAGMFGLIGVLFRNVLIETFGRTPVLISLCFWAGCVGALLFVVLRFGTQPTVDSTAEKHLHYMESAARIVGGGLAGVLVGAMVKMGLVLPVFSHGGSEGLAMCAAAMIAGASERLAAGIVTKTQNNESSKPEPEQSND